MSQQTIIDTTSALVEKEAFGHRLELIADQLGSKRELSRRSGISEAQLYRYLNGESQPTRSSVLKLAESAGVSVNWILTGKNPPAAPESPQFEREQQRILSAVLEHAGQVMLIYKEYRTLASMQHKVIPLLWQAARQEWDPDPLKEFRNAPPITPAKILQMLDFLLAFSSPAVLDVLSEVFCALRYPDGDYPDLSTAVNQLCRAAVRYYDTRSGDHYFERVGQQLWPESANRLTKFIEQCSAHFGAGQNLRWLDVGCGNGRELSYLHRHFQHLELTGVEPSQNALKRVQELEKSQKLPPNCVVEGDARQLPFPSNHFDVVYSKGLLMHLPLIPNCPTGAPEFINETLRVLKPNGLLYLMFPVGNDKTEFLPFNQFFSEQSISEWLKSYDELNLLGHQVVDSNTRKRPGDQAPENYQVQMTMVWKKDC